MSTMRVPSSATDEHPSRRSDTTVGPDLPPELEEALAAALARALVASIRRDSTMMSRITQEHTPS